MSELNENDLKKHVKDKDAWLRFVFMVVLAAAFYLAVLVTFATSLFQFLARLFAGSAFSGLSDFGTNLASYQQQIVLYLTFASEERPFPFAPFPGCKEAPATEDSPAPVATPDADHQEPKSED